MVNSAPVVDTPSVEPAMVNPAPVVETPSVEPAMVNPTPVAEAPNVGPTTANPSIPETNASAGVQSNSGATSNVVTTDGSQPFDISSMFANNNN